MPSQIGVILDIKWRMANILGNLEDAYIGQV